MMIARGARPLAIRVFAAAFLAAATLRLVRGLNDLELSALALARRAPWLAWDRDGTIVALSAEFTIALIPIIWIYRYAAPFARWLVLGFGALKLWSLGLASPTESLLLLLAMASLLTPTARGWFARKGQGEVDPAVFE